MTLPVVPLRRRRGMILLVVVCVAIGAWTWRAGSPDVLGAFADAMTVVFLAYLVRHLMFLASAMHALAGDRGTGSSADPSAGSSTVSSAGSGVAVPVSVLVACRNEQLVVEGLEVALAAIDYPPSALQVVLVDDRSTDRTPAMLSAAADRHANWSVVHRHEDATPGKSAALNAALDLVTGTIVVVFDADHRPRPDTVSRLVRCFDDELVGAAQGRCIVDNPADTWVSRLVAIDYLCGYLVNMVGREQVAGLPAYGGANGAIRLDLLQELGGWNEASVTEDTDITLRVLLRGRRVAYDPQALDTEQAVRSLDGYWRQRYRWARGHQQACRDYRWPVIRSEHLSVVEKIETLLFLYVFHLPVLCAVAIVLAVARSSGVSVAQSIDLWPLIPLMAMGPLVEIGGGLVLGRARRDRVLNILLFPVLFMVSIAVCTKAMFDGLLRRPYGWAKTSRARRPPPPLPPARPTTAPDAVGAPS